MPLDEKLNVIPSIILSGEIDPLIGLSNEDKAFIDKIKWKPDYTWLNKWVAPRVVKGVELRRDNMYLSVDNKILELKKGKQDKANSIFFVSNHQTHKDYFEQLEQLYPLWLPMPEVGIGENLFNQPPKILFNKFFSIVGFMIPRKKSASSADLLNKYEIHELLSGYDLLIYPNKGSIGLTRDGKITEFTSEPFSAPINAQKIADLNGLSLDIFIGPSIIKQEIATEFPLYTAEFEKNKYKDLIRWFEIYKQKSLEYKGSTFITFLKPINVRDWTENETGKLKKEYSTNNSDEIPQHILDKKLRENLAKYSNGLILENSPLVSTDILPYVYTLLGEFGITKENFQRQIEHTIKIAKERNMPIGDNIVEMNGNEIFEHAINIFESQRKPILHYNSGNNIVMVDNVDAFLKYVNRAKQLMDYHYGKTRNTN